jgi:hypothetical protein
VVEDDADVRAYVVETLGGMGYDVLEGPIRCRFRTKNQQPARRLRS